MKDQMEAYLSGRSIISQWYETPEALTFPTITMCLDPATKLSGSQKYGFAGFNDKFLKKEPNRSLVDVFDELTYQLDEDFYIMHSFFNENLMKEENLQLKEGLNKLVGHDFELTKLRTYYSGTCYMLEPKFDITNGLVYMRLKVILNPQLQGMDKPKALTLHFTSNLTWIGIIEGVWPQYYPEKEIISFEKEYTRFQTKVLEKRFAEGTTDGQTCLKEFFSHCPCHLLSYVPSYLPTCETVEEQICSWGDWFNENYTDCFKTKLATTYRLMRVEYPFHAPVNDSFTTFEVEFRFGTKEIQQEIALLTMPDLIGSVGGSLGMFFGFSISATLLFLLDKAFKKVL